MKILIFGPKEPLGGVETIVLAYAKQLILKGCECDFLLYENYPALEAKIYDIGGKCLHATSRRISYSQYKTDLKNIFKTKYDAVWCNFSGLTNIDLLKLAKKSGIPTRIVHSHASALCWGSPLMRILVPIMHYKNKPFIDRYATHIWACSIKSGHFMYPKRIWDKITVWNNGVNLQAFFPDDQKREYLRETLDINNKLVIGHVGRICREKNQYFLLKVYKEFLNRNPNAHLLFLSDAPNDVMVDFAKSLDVDKQITFLTGQQDLPTLYNAMDVFFLPSIIEGLPLVISEAQACGVPCVISTGVSREGDLTGYVDFLSLDDSIEKWCEALENASNKRIPNPASSIRKNNYDILHECQKMYNFFLQNRQGSD